MWKAEMQGKEDTKDTIQNTKIITQYILWCYKRRRYTRHEKKEKFIMLHQWFIYKKSYCGQGEVFIKKRKQQFIHNQKNNEIIGNLKNYRRRTKYNNIRSTQIFMERVATSQILGSFQKDTLVMGIISHSIYRYNHTKK